MGGAYADQAAKEFVLFNLNSPTAGAGTLIGTSGGSANGYGNGAIIGIGQTPVAVIDAILLQNSGGTLDVYLQSSVNALQDGATGNWYDVCHFPQLAAGTSTLRYQVTISRGYNKITAAPVLVNSVDGTPTLAANTVIPDGLGMALRVVLVPGAGATAAAQKINVLLSK